MKKILLAAGLIAGIVSSSFAQNYISGIVSLHGDNTASGTTVVAPGASLILNKNKLYARAGFVNQGDSTAISADSGTLVLSGDGSQGISGRFRISSVQINNSSGVGISNAVTPTMVTILDSVNFGNVSNAVFNAGDSLMTLRSNALKTARIADLSNNGINSGNAVTGKVEVERYLRSRRAWHLLCPPTTGDSANDHTIQAAWQEGARAPRGQLVNPNPGYGTVITRPGSDPVTATGYDDGVANSPFWSIHNYFSNGYYTQPANTDLTHFSPNAAYFLFIRGDRSVSPSTQTSTNQTQSTVTTLRSKGALHNGDVVKTVTNIAGDFAGVANPYACAVDFSRATLSNLQNGFWTWDPSLGSLGAWVYIDGDDDYNATPLTPYGVGVYTDPSTNPLIQSGQAILVKPLSSTGTITFHERDKNITSRVDVFRKVPLPAIIISLFNGDSAFLDGATALFDPSFSKGAVAGEDIGKPANTSESVSFFADSIKLMKQKWPMPSAGDTLPLRLWQTSARKYTFTLQMRQLTSSAQAYLFDKYLQTSTVLQSDNTTAYNFSITSDASSKATDRFAVVFGSSILPVTLSQIKAGWTGTGVQVQWSVTNETGISRYEVERATDGVTFTKIGVAATHGSTAINDTYSFFDGAAVAGDNYYRIKIVEADGSFTYTSVARVSVSGGVMTVTVYPNPVKDRLIHVLFTDAPASSYLLTLYGSDGKTIMTKIIAHPGGTASYQMSAREVAQGLYHVVITGGVDKKERRDIPIAIE